MQCTVYGGICSYWINSLSIEIHDYIASCVHDWSFWGTYIFHSVFQTLLWLWYNHFMPSRVVEGSYYLPFLPVSCLHVFNWKNFLFFDIHPGRIPFAFLEEIHQRFVRTYGRAVLSAQPYAMNDEFSRVLSQQMEYFSSDPNADRINRLKGEMSQVIITSDNFLASWCCFS